jgi:hypothetical protein
MYPKLKIILMGVLSLMMILGIISVLGQRVTLIARGEVAIYENSDGLRIVGKISSGTEVAVLSCQDKKSMIYPLVRLASLEKGYIVFGTFSLTTAGPFDFSSIAPVSFSCP